MSIIEKVIEKVGSKEKDQTHQTHQKKVLASENKHNNDVESLAAEYDSEAVLQSKLEAAPLVDKAEIETSITPSKIITINREKLARQGYLCSENTNVPMFEEYRIIKRPLINNALGAKKNGINRANLILITSSQPGEGKTFTAVNLALSIANEPDKKVLLIDADVAKPSISNVLGIKDNGFGLIDYLEGEELEFSMMVMKTDIPNLNIIPAGKKHGFSTELLASNRMNLLADQLHSRYADRIVIFDSPPLLAATQAEVLAGLVGQVVLVVEAERTFQSMVLESIDKLKVCDVVLALLNKSKHDFDLNYYGYGQYGH